jgi:hypothetical protein
MLNPSVSAIEVQNIAAILATRMNTKDDSFIFARGI